MKKNLTFLLAILIITIIRAQTPQNFNYQIVLRNVNGELIKNSKVGLQISILQDSIKGAVIYSEKQTLVTNANGLLTIKIGKGNNFDQIDLTNELYFIKTEADPTGGTNYTITVVTQL